MSNVIYTWMVDGLYQESYPFNDDPSYIYMRISGDEFRFKSAPFVCERRKHNKWQTYDDPESWVTKQFFKLLSSLDSNCG